MDAVNVALRLSLSCVALLLLAGHDLRYLAGDATASDISDVLRVSPSSTTSRTTRTPKPHRRCKWDFGRRKWDKRLHSRVQEAGVLSWAHPEAPKPRNPRPKVCGCYSGAVSNAFCVSERFFRCASERKCRQGFRCASARFLGVQVSAF